MAIAAIYGVSNHSNLGLNLRWLEPVLVTPRLHRRHHVPSTTQTNYGGIFTIWDRLFGTLVRRDTEPDERFGVPGEIDTYPQAFVPAFRRPFTVLRTAAYFGSARGRFVRAEPVCNSVCVSTQVVKEPTDGEFAAAAETLKWATPTRRRG